MNAHDYKELAFDRIVELQELGVKDIPGYNKSKDELRAMIGKAGVIVEYEYLMYYTGLLYALIEKNKKESV